MSNTFSCKEINSGEFWLNADLGIRCWNSDHLFYAFLLALPTIIIWVILAPLICLINLTKNKKALEEMWMKKRFAFLCSGYNLKHYYWEFIILYYKVTLIGCSAFLSNISANIQALTATLIFVLFLYYHTRNEPFGETFFNKAETFSRLASLITILAGLSFLTNDLGTVPTYFLLLLLIIANILFIVYILANFLMQFAIISIIIGKIGKALNLKAKKYAAEIAPLDESEQSDNFKEIQSQAGKYSSTMVFSDNTKIGNTMMFRENLSSSNELDPFASEQSISNMNES